MERADVAQKEFDRLGKLRVDQVDLYLVHWPSPDMELPAVLGNDISGTIEQSRADDFAEGEDVFGFAPSGGYAEFAVAPAGAIAKKPPGVSHAQAAALPVSGLTAWQGLFDVAGLQAGQLPSSW